MAKNQKTRRELWDIQIKKILWALADKDGLNAAHLAHLCSIEFRSDVDLSLSKENLVLVRAKYRAHYYKLLANLGTDFLGSSPACEVLTIDNLDLVYVLYYEGMYRRFRSNGRIYYNTDGKGAAFYLAEEKNFLNVNKLEGVLSDSLTVAPVLEAKINPTYLFEDESKYTDAEELTDPEWTDEDYALEADLEQ